jgi:alpha-L-rhamnosidase
MMGYLVGLRIETPGFKMIHVEPIIIPDLNWAAGSFQSAYGTVSNRWERKAGRIAMRLVIPPNSAAHVILPSGAKEIILDGVSVSALPTGGLAVKSGSYEFAWTE